MVVEIPDETFEVFGPVSHEQVSSHRQLFVYDGDNRGTFDSPLGHTWWPEAVKQVHQQLPGDVHVPGVTCTVHIVHAEGV